MSGKIGSITTDIIKNGLVFNMDAANRVSYVPNATINKNTINLSQTGSFINDTAFLSPPISASCFSLDGTDAYIDVPNAVSSYDSLSSHYMTICAWVKPNLAARGNHQFYVANDTRASGTNNQYLNFELQE